MSLNVVALQGRLVRDPEQRQTNSGKTVAKSTIAVNGYKKDDVSFIEFTAWDKQADFLCKYFKQGSELIISGSIKQEKWEKDGQKRSKITVNANNINFCGSKNGDGIAQQNAQNVNQVFNTPPQVENKINELNNVANYPWMSDENIPF